MLLTATRSAATVWTLSSLLMLSALAGCSRQPSTSVSDAQPEQRSAQAEAALGAQAEPAAGQSRQDSELKSPAPTSGQQRQPAREPNSHDQLALAAQSADEAGRDPLDWTYWRGPRFDGTSLETGLVDDFDPRGGEGSLVAWKRDDLGGRSTPMVMKGLLYTIVRDEPGTEREGEKVVCVDAETGETVWENRFNVSLSDVPDTRVGWSSVVGDPETDHVYALGVSGYFQCIDAKTGKTVWDYPLHEQFGLLSTYGGRTNFPIVCDDLVIVSGVIIGWGEMAKPAHRFLAFDKLDGTLVWFNGTRPLPYDTTYSAPVLAVFNGQKALVFGSGDGSVWAFQPRTGQPIWHCQLSRRGLNAPPLVVGDTVYIGHSEENVEGTTTMGALAAIDGTGQGDLTGSDQLLWKELGLMAGRSAPLHIDGHLYCIDDRAKLHVLDAETGETLATKNLGTMMRSSPLYADGKLYVFTANGRWYILRPQGAEGVEVVSRGRMPSGEEVHGAPICSHHKIYVHSSGALYCLEDSSKEAGAQPPPQQRQEAPLEEAPEPALVQVIPAEMLTEPGQAEQLRVRLFNRRGQFLHDPEDATFELAGPGQISPSGTYLSPEEAEHQAATITARVGDLRGEARVRIVPPLPWHFDFEGLQEPPVTWVGARYRHVIREVDGEQLMVKITTIPKGTRSRCWFGPPDLHDYTITADVRGQLQGKLPDIGLIAQGYALDLQGENQALQIRSWVPHDRRAQKTIDVAWQGEQWYVLKLQASMAGDQAVLRGKVWPRGEQEPADWTVELTDDKPNTHGSPGLFGNAKDAEIFLDNVRVTANQETG